MPGLPDFAAQHACAFLTALQVYKVKRKIVFFLCRSREGELSTQFTKWNFTISADYVAIDELMLLPTNFPKHDIDKVRRGDSEATGTDIRWPYVTYTYTFDSLKRLAGGPFLQPTVSPPFDVPVIHTRRVHLHNGYLLPQKFKIFRRVLQTRLCELEF